MIESKSDPQAPQLPVLTASSCPSRNDEHCRPEIKDIADALGIQGSYHVVGQVHLTRLAGRFLSCLFRAFQFRFLKRLVTENLSKRLNGNLLIRL